MRVLVCRARDDGERTAARLAAQGHSALLAPAVEIVGTGAPLPDDSFNAVVATSDHALRAWHAVPPALHGLPWLVVGKRLQARLAGWNVVPVLVSPAAAALAEGIEARVPAPAALLYLAGRDRKPHLEQSLQSRRYRLTVVETYEARAIPTLDVGAATALRTGALGAALHFSRRSAGLFVRGVVAAGLATEAARIRHLAISADAAVPLRDQGWTAEVAPTPDERSLLGLLGTVG